MPTRSWLGASVAVLLFGVCSVVVFADGEASVAELRERGMRHYAADDYAKAIHAFETALERADEKERGYLEELLARTRSAVGLELFNSGEVRQAERMFRLALRSAGDPYAHFGVGYLHFVRFENALAQEQLTKAVEGHPDNSLAYKLLALLDYRAGEISEALKKIGRAVELRSDDAEAKALRKRWRREVEYASRLKARVVGRFAIRSDRDLPPETVRFVIGALKKAEGELSEALGYWSRHRLTVVLYPNNAFHRVTGSQHWVGGTYDGQIKLPIPQEPELSPALRAQLRRAVRHELPHAAIRELAPTCPTWLNEGIAQHFEYDGELGGKVDRKLWEVRDRALSFDELPLRMTSVDDGEAIQHMYLQALSFVEFLEVSFHQFRIRLLLDALREEGSVRDSFQATYGRTLEQLEGDWWKHVERRANPEGRVLNDDSPPARTAKP